MFGTSSLRSFKKSHIGILSQNSLFHLHYRESASASIAAIRIMEVQEIQAPAFTSALDQKTIACTNHICLGRKVSGKRIAKNTCRNYC